MKTFFKKKKKENLKQKFSENVVPYFENNLYKMKTEMGKVRRHDTQYNDTQYNDIQHNNTQNKVLI